MYRKNGFTIVELIIVIVAIAILVILVVVGYSTISTKASVANLQSYLNMASKQIQLDYASSGQYPSSLSQIDSGRGLKANPSISVSYAVDNTVGAQKYCVLVRTGTTVYSIDGDSPPTPGVAACSIIPLTNLLSNGDFSNGTSGWAAGYGSISATSNTLSMTSNGGATYSQVSQACSNCAVNGNKVYGSVKQRVTSSMATALGVLISDPGGNKNIPTFYNPTSNFWYSNNGIVNFTSSGQLTFKPYYSYVDAATANGKVMEIQYAMAIDLTYTFGAGNEPSAAQMTSVLSQLPNNWFDGTVSINIAGIL